MTIRSLDLLDLPTLYRYRGEAVSLDTTRTLTRGMPFGAAGMLAYINPRRHLYSAVSTDGGAALLGGIIHTNGDPHAQMLYLAPVASLEHPELPALIESLSAEAGSWGAFHVLAEVDESSSAFTPLRRAGFSVYARQRMWDVTQVGATAARSKWRRAKPMHLPDIQNLHHQIVPPLLQPVEPAPRRASGFICTEGGACHAGTSTGMNGIVVFPLMHPDATDAAEKLSSLIHFMPGRGTRHIYVCVRTYQAWLERVLEDLGAKPGPEQAVMVKHMTRPVKEEQAVLARQPANVSIQPSRVNRLEEKK